MEENRCYILELPAELRLSIYDYIYQTRTIHNWVDWNVYRWKSYTPTGATSLLATCKTIQREAAPIFYDKTSVHFSICDEFERPLSRYRRFSSLADFNATSFDLVSKVRLSLHTLTEPIFKDLLRNLDSWLRRLKFCAHARAIEIHFEFWSTISDEDLYRIYDVLCNIQYDREVEIGTRTIGCWMNMYEAANFRACVEQVRDDIIARRQGTPLSMQNEDICSSVGPRDLIIRSKTKTPGRSRESKSIRTLTGRVYGGSAEDWLSMPR